MTTTDHVVRLADLRVGDVFVCPGDGRYDVVLSIEQRGDFRRFIATDRHTHHRDAAETVRPLDLVERSEKAARRLRDIATIIDTEPSRYRQEQFFAIPIEAVQGDHPDEAIDRLDASSEHWCKTTACIAGWSWMLDNADETLETLWYSAEIGWVGLAPSASITSIIDLARDAMGLTGSEAAILFGGPWRPINGLSVGDALRAVARGVPVPFVTNERWWGQ